MTEITRHYDSAENAERTVERLKTSGFTASSIAFSAPTAGKRHWTVSVQPVFGMGRTATEILDRFNPVAAPVHYERELDPGLESIHRLSQAPSLGAIPRLSRSVSPGSISSLSGWKSPGAISKLSGYKSPGAISKLSRSKSPGAISRLSRSTSSSSISRLSSGWYVSNLFGLPLLTRSQSPIEPDKTLLVKPHSTRR